MLPLTILGVVIAASCDAAPIPTPWPDATSIRDLAVQELRAIQSAAFRIEHKTGSTNLGFGSLTEAEGIGVFPEQASFTAKVIAPQFGDIALAFDIIQTEGNTYLRDQLTRQWQIVPAGALAINFSNINQSIADGLATMSGAALKDGSSIDGVDTHLLVGAIEAASLQGLVPSASEDTTLRLSVWVGIDDLLVRKVSIAGVLLPNDPQDLTRVLYLRDFGVNLQIAPPI